MTKTLRQPFGIGDKVIYSGLAGIVKGTIDKYNTVLVKFPNYDKPIACLTEYCQHADTSNILPNHFFLETLENNL